MLAANISAAGFLSWQVMDRLVKESRIISSGTRRADTFTNISASVIFTTNMYFMEMDWKPSEFPAYLGVFKKEIVTNEVKRVQRCPAGGPNGVWANSCGESHQESWPHWDGWNVMIQTNYFVGYRYGPEMIIITTNTVGPTIQAFRKRE